MKFLNPFLILLIILTNFSSFLKIDFYVLYQNSSIDLPENAKILGRLNGDERIRIVMSLKLKNSEFLESMITRGLINAPLSEEELSHFLPSVEEYSELLGFVKKANPENITIYSNRLLLSFTAKASNIEKLLNLKFYLIHYNDSFYYYSTVPMLSYDIAKIIGGIFGLNNIFRFKNQLELIDASNLLTVDQVRKFYGIDKLINAGYDGSGQTIVIGSVGTFDQKDIHLFASRFGLDVPEIEKYEVLGPVDKPEVETTLDLEWAFAIAPRAKLILVTIPDPRFFNFVELFNFIVSRDLGKIVSVSWLIEENLLSKNDIEILHSIFLLGVAKGINFFIPSGDWGSSNSPRFPFSSESINNTIAYYPASDPLVISVGGTDLVSSEEIAWGGVLKNGTYGSGGGYSKYFKRPFYQPKEIGNMRGLPDVSYLSGNTRPYTVFFKGELKAAYGTSIASPQWAAIAAILAQISSNNLGFLNYRLYDIYRSEDYKLVFKDIVKGNNGYYNASKGWDPVTGLGSPNAQELVYRLAKNLKSLYILPLSSDSLKIRINETLREIPTVIDFKDTLSLRISLNKTIYLDKGTRYLYNSTKGVIETTSDNYNLTVKDSGNLLIIYRKQYLVNATANIGYVEGTGWYDEGEIINLRVINPLYPLFYFKGWKGDVVSNSPYISILVNKSYELRAEFDFSILGLAFFITVMVSLILSLLLIFIRYRKIMRRVNDYLSPVNFFKLVK